MYIQYSRRSCTENKEAQEFCDLVLELYERITACGSNHLYINTDVPMKCQIPCQAVKIQTETSNLHNFTTKSVV